MGDGKRDYCADEIACRGQKRSQRDGDASAARAEAPHSAGACAEVPKLAVVRARAVWLEVGVGVRGSATALMGWLDALMDPRRVAEANMLAGWKAKYENEITKRMKMRWWRRMAWRQGVREARG